MFLFDVSSSVADFVGHSGRTEQTINGSGRSGNDEM